MQIKVIIVSCGAAAGMSQKQIIIQSEQETSKKEKKVISILS